MSLGKFTNKFLIIRGPATGLVVHKTNLVPVEKTLHRNVKILGGEHGGKHVQITDLLIPGEIKTLNGNTILIANTTLVGVIRHLQKKEALGEWWNE